MRILLTLSISAIVAFSDISIVTSANNPISGISKEDLVKIYLKKIDTINNVKVIPVDNKEAYNEFCEKVINKTPKQLHAYWMKEIYRGDKEPPEKLSTSEIQKKIKENPRIISYTKSKITGKIIFTIK
jgi:hypothetical protein